MPRSKTIACITYILGENAIENHKIIKNANYNHWWFHLDDTTSGHCIVESEKINNNIMTIAGNYIKKYSKLKNHNKVNICYTQIKNIKLLDKPGSVEFYKDINYFECYSTKIYHSSINKGGTASEYIIPQGQINITSHGIGSGIYGITKKTDKPNFYEFNLENPYILETNKSCDNYIRSSLYLNERMNNYKTHSVKFTAYEFSKLMPEFDEEYVFKKLKEFKADYKNRKDMVMMPINYILMGYNYDGIYSRNTIMDSFSKGNIKFTDYPSKKNKLPVEYFKRRSGVDEYIIKY